MENKIQSSTLTLFLKSFPDPSIKTNHIQSASMHLAEKICISFSPSSQVRLPILLDNGTCPIDAPLYACNSTLEKPLEWNYPVLRELRIQLTFMAVGESLLRSYTSTSVLHYNSIWNDEYGTGAICRMMGYYVPALLLLLIGCQPTAYRSPPTIFVMGYDGFSFNIFSFDIYFLFTFFSSN